MICTCAWSHLEGVGLVCGGLSDLEGVGVLLHPLRQLDVLHLEDEAREHMRNIQYVYVNASQV